ncbi:hypothetical protein ACHAWX_002589 [Stephanocyclus meneghinianus]
MKKSFMHFAFSRSHHETERNSQGDKGFDFGVKTGTDERDRATRGNTHRPTGDKFRGSPTEKLKRISNMVGSVTSVRVNKLDGIEFEEVNEAQNEDGKESLASASSRGGVPGCSRDSEDMKKRLIVERRHQKRVASHERNSRIHSENVLESISQDEPTMQNGGNHSAMSQHDKDEEITERLKRERREQQKVASSMRQSASHPQNVLDVSKLPTEDQMNQAFLARIVGGCRTSEEDKTQGNMSSAMSQEEKDNEIKERLKRERREQRKVASSMRQSASHPQHVLDMSKLTSEGQNNQSDHARVSGDFSTSGDHRTQHNVSPSISQETKDKEIKERLKRERREQRKVSSSMGLSASHPRYVLDMSKSITKNLSNTFDPQVGKDFSTSGEDRTQGHMSPALEREVASSMRLSASHLKYDPGISQGGISSGYEIFEKEANEEIQPNKYRYHNEKTQKQEICDDLIRDTTSEKSKSRREMNTQNVFRLVTSLDASFDVDDDLSKRIAEKMREKQMSRKKSRRHKQDTSDNNMQTQDRRKSIAAWTHKYDLRRAVILAEKTPEMDWLSSFYRCDPRWQILKFFNEVAREGGDAKVNEDLAASPLSYLFDKANVFTVWRPTSDEAIKNMMLGIATGKGLDIKGKIYTDQHTEQVRTFIKNGRTIRLFYQSEDCRSEAHEMLVDVKDYMRFAAEDAMRVLSDEFASQAEQDLAMKHLMYDDINLVVEKIDTYINSSPSVYGLCISERLFWEAYVMAQDCSRPAGTEWDIGRGSELNFMEMNFKTMRHEPKPGDARPVVYQMSTSSPMEPRTLLIAYEENGTVKPVVSDFDCFLTGTRGVKYKQPIPNDQVDLLKWSVNNISEVLDERVASQLSKGWMETWFNVLKTAALKGFYPHTPRYGNGDPTSYKIIEVAVSRLRATGCVRHGAECFNFFFPQDIDDTLLIISDTLPGNVKWRKVNVQQLQSILMDKIDEGFTFRKALLPLLLLFEVAWVLCDPGWRRVYDKLLASQLPNVQDSLNCWLPPDTGLRQKIDEISRRHPHGFSMNIHKSIRNPEGTELMDMMEDKLQRYIKIQRAWRKLRLALFWIRFVREKRRLFQNEDVVAREK